MDYLDWAQFLKGGTQSELVDYKLLLLNNFNTFICCCCQSAPKQYKVCTVLRQKEENLLKADSEIGFVYLTTQNKFAKKSYFLLFGMLLGRKL